MSLNTLAIKSGITALTPTGGSALSVVVIDTPANQIKTFIDESLDYNMRKEVDVSFKRPQVNAGVPTGMSKKRTTITARFPRLCDDGVSRDVDVVKIEIAPSVELSDAEVKELRFLAAQIIVDPAMDAVINDQSNQ